MKGIDTSAAEADWVCMKCGLPLEIGKVEIGYLGSMFPVELYRCSRCGQALITEDLAIKKMAEVEKLLEDK